jgi:hypothetical protein
MPKDPDSSLLSAAMKSVVRRQLDFPTGVLIVADQPIRFTPTSVGTLVTYSDITIAANGSPPRTWGR